MDPYFLFWSTGEVVHTISSFRLSRRGIHSVVDDRVGLSLSLYLFLTMEWVLSLSLSLSFSLSLSCKIVTCGGSAIHQNAPWPGGVASAQLWKEKIEKIEEFFKPLGVPTRNSRRVVRLLKLFGHEDQYCPPPMSSLSWHRGCQRAILIHRSSM